MLARHVDADSHVWETELVPLNQLAARRFEGPVTQVVYEARGLRYGYEYRRWDVPAGWMLPTRQRFHRNDLATRDLDDWLIDEAQLAIGDCTCEVISNIDSLRRGLAHRLGVEHGATAVGLLGGIEGRIGSTKKLGALDSRVGFDGDACARPYVELALADGHW